MALLPRPTFELEYISLVSLGFGIMNAFMSVSLFVVVSETTLSGDNTFTMELASSFASVFLLPLVDGVPSRTSPTS